MRQPGELGGGVISGSITYKGMNLLDYSSHDVVNKLGISLVPEGRRVFGNLQVFYVEKIAFILIDRSNQLL
jgi:ABC-type branched-subunit amino acid transport system ATPase component